MRRKMKSATVQIIKVFFVISLITFLALGSTLPALSATYGLSSNDPALTFYGTIYVTDVDETRGINYFGTGTLKNYGDITAVTTGAVGISYGIYSNPSAGLIYNGGSITATSVGDNTATHAIFVPVGFNTLTNDGSITANGIGVASAISSGIETLNSVVNNSGIISVNSSAPVFMAWGIINTNGVVNNNGTISASGNGTGSVFSVYAPNEVVNNSGTILATGNGSGAVYGAYVPNGILNNSGTISASGNSTGSIQVYAAATIGGQTINSGTLSATGSGVDATVFGLQTSGSPTINSGTISAASNGSGAVSAQGVNYADSQITNTGTISASASGSGGGPAVAYGISGGGGTLVNNSGSISASATGVAGIPVHAFGIITNDTVLNSGNISATANGDNCTAAGIYSMASGVTNTGNVIVDAASMNTGLVYGINSNGEVSNAGNITTTARGGLNNTAYGIGAADNVANTGNINVTAATTASGGISNADGITTIGTVSNAGNITVYSQGDISNAHGIMANVTVSNAGNIAVYSQGDISNAVGILSAAGTNANNSGEIIVTSVGSTSHAYGIYFMNGGALTNTGIIRAGDDNAYEVYVNAGVVDLLNSYKMTLDGNPAKGSIFLNAGSAINLNSSQFSVSAAPDTRFYTQYRIFDGTGTVNGAFGSVAPAQNPAVSVLYHNQGTAGSADDTVSLSYHPRTSPFLEGINVNRYLINAALAPVQQQQINGFLNILLPGTPIQMAANDTVASDAPGNLIKSTPDDNVYIIPYYAYLDKDSNRLGYKVNSTGFTAGYEKRFSRTQLGVHLGYGFADIDFKGSDFPKSTEDQQKIFSLGFHGMTRWGNWTLRGDLTGFYDHHDYEGVSGVNFEAREKADYNSWGTTENLLGGYAFKAGTNVLLPEIGLNHTWVRQEGSQTSATFGGWETDNSSVDNNLFQALASLRWLSRFSLREIPCTTSLTVGGRYRMSNDDLTVQQSVPGSSPVTVTSDQDRAAVTASFSLALRKDNISSELAYSGDYSNDNILHAVWLKIAYAF